MYQKALTSYYFLAGFLLMTGLFVLQPTDRPEVLSLQSEIKQEFSIAWQQTIGDQPYFTEVAEIFEYVNEFYTQTATETVALLADPESDQDIAYVFGQVYQSFAHSFDRNPVPVAQKVQIAVAQEEPVIDLATFMTEEPIGNIVPEKNLATGSRKQATERVAGISIAHPVNLDYPWVTLQDNLTGQKYCVALYNGEVNKYLGPCKMDYH